MLATSCLKTSLPYSVLCEQKILIVEPNRAAARSLLSALDMAGGRGRVVATLREALALGQSFFPDILITRLKLPDGDGFDLLDQLKIRLHRSDKPLVAIAITDLSSLGQNRTLAQGFQYYLFEPFDPCQVLTTLQEVVTCPVPPFAEWIAEHDDRHPEVSSPALHSP